jgi:hypothetical protein
MWCSQKQWLFPRTALTNESYNVDVSFVLFWEINWIFMYNSDDIRIPFLHCTIWSKNYWDCQSHPHNWLNVKIILCISSTLQIWLILEVNIKKQKNTGRSHFTPGLHSWKTSHKLNTKFPFKTVSLLGINKLTSSCIAYYYTTCQRFTHRFQIGLLHLMVSSILTVFLR